jgi:hypothetical protein
MNAREKSQRVVWYDLDPFAWYDLDPLERQLWVVEGPAGYRLEDLDPSDLPPGFRWIDADEWHERRSEVEVVSSKSLSA